MVEQRSPSANDTRHDQAISWHIRLGAPDASEDDWLGFTQWLEADPENRIAFDQVEALDDELRFAGATTGERPSIVRADTRTGNRTAWTTAAVAALAAAVAIFFVVQPAKKPTQPSATYATQTGEIRTVTLADGTRVDLNTASNLSVDGNRHAQLSRGEALFHVAKDAVHPFVVAVGDRQVRVVGTVFNVLRSDGTVTVTVSEGRVGVSRAGGIERQLGPGERLTCIEGGDAQTAERVDPSEATSWREGYLVFHAAPLSKVVADLNRYFANEVVVETSAATQQFTGVLRIDDQDAVLRRLAEFLPITTVRTTDGKIVLRRTTLKP